MFNVDFNKEIEMGASLVSIGSSAIMSGSVSNKIKVENIANKIQEYLKHKETASISELVSHFEESADIILKSLKFLKNKGLIQEN